MDSGVEVVKRLNPVRQKLEKWYHNMDHFNFWVTRDSEHQQELKMILSHYNDFK
jgi:hypothetical protein